MRLLTTLLLATLYVVAGNESERVIEDCACEQPTTHPPTIRPTTECATTHRPTTPAPTECATTPAPVEECICEEQQTPAPTECECEKYNSKCTVANEGSYSSYGLPPSQGYMCAITSTCGTNRCSCNGACYDPTQYCCYDGFLGQAKDTICSCPDYVATPLPTVTPCVVTEEIPVAYNYTCGCYYGIEGTSYYPNGTLVGSTVATATTTQSTVPPTTSASNTTSNTTSSSVTSFQVSGAEWNQLTYTSMMAVGAGVALYVA